MALTPARREAAEIESALATEEGHISELFTTFRRPLLLGIMLAGLQQISGITPLFSFLPEIFRAAGTATSDAFFQSVLVSLVNLCSLFSPLAGGPRRAQDPDPVRHHSVQFVSFALVGWFYHIHGSGVAVLIFVMSFVAGHAFGNGVACWVIISEIYPTKVRGRGMSIATTALWLVGYVGEPDISDHAETSGIGWVRSGSSARAHC
jgi:SP family arabinose:H+ symporter-like MFS transporter